MNDSLTGNATNLPSVREIAAAITRARSLLVITGAGISAESGLPTYRGIGGLYERELTEEQIPIEVALSGEMMQRRPALTWKYIQQIEAACRGAQCNTAHRLVAALQARVPRSWVLTQNIDGFHAAAGSRDIIDIHGDVHELHCTACDWAERVADYAALAPLPTCPCCGALLRPRVVLFGEMLPDSAIRAYDRMMAAQPDVVLSIGTTSVFPYIAAPVLQARRRGALTVEINPGESEVSDVVDVRLRTGAVAALTAIAAALPSQ